MYFNSKNALKALLTFTLTLSVLLPTLYAQTNVCAGSTNQLSYSGSGGSWVSSNAGVATVSTNGLVTGVSAGSSTVSYQVPGSSNVSLSWNFDNTPTQSGSILTYNASSTTNSALLSGYYSSSGSSQAVNPFSTWGNSVKQTNFGPDYSYIQFVTTATTTNLSSMVFTVWHNHNNGQAGTGNYNVRLQISTFNGTTWSAWTNIGNNFTWSSTPTAAPSPNTGHNISLTGNSVPAGTHRIRWKKDSGSTSTGGDGYIMNTVTFNCQGVTTSTPYTTVVNVTNPATSPTGISGSSSICPGNSVVLTANGGTGSFYQWGTGAVGSNVISGATGATYTASPTTTTTYWVRRVQQSPCTGFTNGATFTVNLANTNTNLTLTDGDYIWQGATSADLKATSNWMVFTSPNNYSIATNALSSSINIFIPKLSTCVNGNFPVVRQPEVTSPNTMVDDITILPDAVLTFIDEDLYVAGNWLNNGSFDPSNDNVRLNGNGTQTIGGSGINNFFGLRMYENSNQQDVFLNSDISVSDELRFYDDANLKRNIVLGNYDLTMHTGANNGSITIRSTAANTNTYDYTTLVSTVGYIKTNGIGKLVRRVTSSNFVFFPIGNTDKNHCAINNTGDDDVFAMNVLDNVTDDGSGLGATTAAPVVKRTWMVDELVTGGSVVDMRLYWNGASDEINGFDLATQFVGHHTGIDWENLGATSNSTAPLFIQKDDISSFSPFTIGSLGGSPLPVELTSFNAVCEEGKGVNVTWSTASEHNSSHFDVLKSDDGYNWRSIATVSAAGNSTSSINYGMMDAEKANGVAYYKLMQYDIDGQSKEYGPISVGCNSVNEMIIKTFPNPSGNEFYVELISPEATSTVITIIDAQGKSVYTRTVETEKGTNLYTFESLNVLPGMYYIQISNDLTTPNVVKHSFR